MTCVYCLRGARVHFRANCVVLCVVEDGEDAEGDRGNREHYGKTRRRQHCLSVHLQVLNHTVR